VSVEAITWALGQDVGRSTVKFVLTILANCADGKEFICFPSVAYIAEATNQDRKTVIGAIAKLIEMGFVEDTGERRGSTGQIIVYKLLVGKNGTVKESQKRNSSENGTVPKTDSKSTENGSKQYRKRTERVPKTVHGTVSKRKEPSGNRQSSSPTASQSAARGTRLPADWVLTRAPGVWAASEQPTWTPEHIRKVAESFKDYWIAQPGTKGRKTDWEATWRNWVRNEPALGGQRAGSGTAGAGAVNWFESAAGIAAQGESKGLTQRENEAMPDFLVRVAQASGRGPWIDHVLREARRGNEKRFQQIVEFFGDALMPSDF
jgi:hypothetical protein